MPISVDLSKTCYMQFVIKKKNGETFSNNKSFRYFQRLWNHLIFIPGFHFYLFSAETILCDDYSSTENSLLFSI